MQLLPPGILRFDSEKLNRIDHFIKSIYRLIIYSRDHLDDDLLDAYLNGVQELQELISLKNAQMEAQNEEEAKEYLKNLKVCLHFVIEEIIQHRNFEKEIQLFQLLRLVSPETSALHPNRYRDSLVQVGGHLCPESRMVPRLVSELFFKMQSISNPVIRAVYFHHEMIRIHPFLDGNGRVTRVAKNWMLMYDLYPPIFINDGAQKKEYIETLSGSFRHLDDFPGQWNPFTESFFEQELDRLLENARLLYDTINGIGLKREKERLKE